VLPKRPTIAKETPAPKSPPPPPAAPEPESIDDFWSNIQVTEDFDAEQERLRQQWELEQQQQNAMLRQQQQEFEEQQRMLAEQQRLAEQQLIRDQYARQAQGHVAELERQLLELQGQQDNNCLLLESYDNVRTLSLIYHSPDALLKLNFLHV